eukprot:gb/GEZN01001958.1/.p1 GENE.gb/GEZN01001958.1/~~gb/GEZN01001958.1/.p1  ORF type:complete len:446 (-),score=69.26 gb/GEZN01001958.1/:1385-2698(-)
MASVRKDATSTHSGHNHATTETEPIPVTIITGFLGSGKTTLLSHILKDKSHGRRIAVINNEFSHDVKVGTLNEMSSSSPSDEEPALSVDIYETKSGCLCCGGGGDDFRRILHELLHHKSKYDYVVVETTGMADPAFSKLFFLDPVLKKSFFIDGFVTLVDAKHGLSQLEAGRTKKLRDPDEEEELTVLNEAYEQLAVADRVLINKVDLVSPQELEKLETVVKSINPTAVVYNTKYAEVSLDCILGIRAFDLGRVEAYDKDFLSFRPDRVHDQLMESTALVGEGALPSSAAFKAWLSVELEKYKVLRSKGFVEILGQEERCVFQGVRSLLDMSKGPCWPLPAKTISSSSHSEKSAGEREDSDKPCHRIVLIGPSIREHQDKIVSSFLRTFNPGRKVDDKSKPKVSLRVYQVGRPPMGWQDILFRLVVALLVLYVLYNA